MYFCEITRGNLGTYLFLCLPVEYILFYLMKHSNTKLAKLGFTVITATLYGLCYLVYIATFKLLLECPIR